MKLNHSFYLILFIVWFFYFDLRFFLQDYNIYLLIRVFKCILRHKHSKFARWGRWGRRGRLWNRVHHDLTQPSPREYINVSFFSITIYHYLLLKSSLYLYSIFYRRHLYLIYRYLLDFNFFSSFFENLKLHLFGI